MVVESRLPAPNDIPKPQRLIELGWLIVDELPEAGLKAVEQARDNMLASLQAQFGQFQWRMPCLRQPDRVLEHREEAVVLLHEGLHERNNRHWDYAFVITQADLKSYYQSYTLAVPSQALDVAVISLARLMVSTESKQGAAQLAKRIQTLGMHLLGDLNSLGHRREPEAFMYSPQDIEELDRMNIYSEPERQQLEKVFAEVADVRLEEQPRIRKTGALAFYLRAIGHVGDEILRAVIQAKPWEFPFRLSRLTTAALSTLLILLMTAEAWDLGMNQSLPSMTVLSLLMLVGTSAFILKRQRLLLHRGRRRLTEQTVVTHVSISLVVLLGMATTYVMLLLLVLSLSQLLFNPALVASWAASVPGPIGPAHYLALAEMIATLGMLIGALGASFEGQYYFQHIAYADEEL